ncbi:pirin family protein [Flavobacterium sp. CF136]|uniref:pirin family protein n=1 Tax=Flavobacterium sp. (strain CF136) TaxID=1144313 RepID=UPI000271967C|nr:pirin family protein [Flavobacterium sp. CF136]EJL64728.1 Pirin-related protein [Flavobacterium sp. CF136]
MLQKINNSMFVGNGPIKILYPGTALSNTDTGIGSIGRIDHPEIHGNTIIRMHPHINDEILSYFRTGQAEHSDSEGFVKTIGKKTLMLMKAGKSFYHEEKILGQDEPMEGLQIFIRPSKKDLNPEVVFLDLKTIHSENKWRLLASPNPDTTFQFSSQTWLYDMKLLQGNSSEIPELPKSNLTALLYVFQGSVQVNSTIDLRKKEGIVFKNESIIINAPEDAELVLFVTDEEGEIFKDGMYSGNQM